MFNLDQAITEWRRKLADAGLNSRDILDELESHVREDIERRIRSGANPTQVFQIVVNQFGPPRSIKAEFEKIEERKYMKRSVMIGIGIVGVLVGMALVMPAVAQYRHEGVMRNDEPWLFLIGSLLTLAGCAAAVGYLKRTRA